MGCSAQLSLSVLAGLQRLRETCPPNRFLTVNLSPHDLADPQVQEQFRGSWTGVIIELTEAAWPEDPDSVLAGVEIARQAGARIASDDVGAGYAGLLQLVRLRPDLIKVDRALVSLLGTDPAADSVLRLLGELASQLDSWVLVEGVDTQGQLAVALRLGAPLAQGWLFGRAEAPWPSDPDLSGVRGLRLRTTFTDTVAAFLRDADPGEVRYDRDGRPVEVLVAGTWITAMTLAVSTSAWVAVERSLHRRNAAHRLAPLAVTDGRGMLIGLVDVEPLVLAHTPSLRVSDPDKRA
jgi:EAL domain-containing protein (putative c-di-GMP-specific phosphodiesterase class I)